MQGVREKAKWSRTGRKRHQRLHILVIPLGSVDTVLYQIFASNCKQRTGFFALPLHSSYSWHKLHVIESHMNPRSRMFSRCCFAAAVSSRVHFVASHFIAGTIRRQPFRWGYTWSPAVSSRGHFVAGTLRRWSTKKTVEFAWARRQHDEPCANRTYTCID